MLPHLIWIPASRDSHLIKERLKHNGPIREQSSMHPPTQYAMVKSGPAWFSPLNIILINLFHTPCYLDAAVPDL